MPELTHIEVAVLDAMVRLGDRWTLAYAIAPLALVSANGCVIALHSLAALGLVEINDVHRYRITSAGQEVARG